MWFCRRLRRVKWNDRRSSGSILRGLSAMRKILLIVNVARLNLYFRPAVWNKNHQYHGNSASRDHKEKKKKERQAVLPSYNVTMVTGMGIQEQFIAHKCLDRENW
ncbi:hypothetical protein ElyMa_005038500 [Elysia marginata]|uniref:Uncharacterized protein n=1 Tax=Elysia marginata TaxID=1093978 RepID=A0AAV4JCZ7_9GAST|nr:hypothetical protein ElyMa_005038500 [Elysia marginata]